MKIVILADQIAPQLGGAIGVAYQQARLLAGFGHTVHVVAGRGAAASDDRFTLHCLNLSIPERYRAYLGVHYPAARRRLRPLLAALQPEVVHAHNIYGALSYRCLTEARRVAPRVFLTAHDVMSFAYAKLAHFIPHHLRHPAAVAGEDAPPPTTSSAHRHQSNGAGQVDPLRAHYPERFNYRTPWWVNLSAARKRYNPCRNVLIRRHLQRITKVLAVSQALADALSDNGITNVAVVRNGIDLAPWRPPSAAVLAAFRSRHGLVDRRVVLFTGRISGAKGINQILHALAAVAPRVPAVLLCVVGAVEGGGRQHYQELPARYGVAGQTRFLGELEASDMQLAYHACDVVAVPSVCFDSFPSVNLEAMAAGKPVVATCFGGSREAVADGETGFIVNPYDTPTLADRISQLLTDNALAARMGQAGRRRVEREFSADRWISQLLEWYQR